MENPNSISNDDLARMITSGFEDLSARIEAAASDSGSRFDEQSSRIGGLRSEMHDEFTALRGQVVHFPEFHDLVERVEKLEKTKS